MLSLGLAFLSQMKLRLDTTHMLSAIVPAAILAAWVVRRLTAMPRRVTGQTLVDAGVTLYLLAVLAAVHFPRLLIFYVIPYSTPLVPLPLERATGILVEADEARDLTAAVRFVQACVPPSREIFVGNSAHDQVFMNHDMFYYRPVAGFGEYLIFRRVRGTPAFLQPPPGPCGGEPRSP